MSITLMRFGARLRLASLGFIFAAALVTPAFAAGGLDDDKSSTDKPKQTDLTTCDKGKVWDTKSRACLTQQSGVLGDSELADYAFALAKAERYEEALQVLDLSKDSNTPKALNYRGYATRKLGKTAESIDFYLKAVALDPNYVQVREYLGEAYVTQGKLDLAKEQLAKIKTLCGANDCDEYHDLEKAVNAAGKL
jgi:tetratricopeptide (TPR) repeat protein